jgi:hypothetical protein
MTSFSKNRIAIASILFLFLLVMVSIAFLLMRKYSPGDKIKEEFNGQRALAAVEYQVSRGPRTPGSPAHAQTVEWIKSELLASGWEVEIQETEMMGHPVKNIVARWGEGRPWVILGAHYDTRFLADQDPDPENRDQPVPGANDGASGVAVLLELARVIPGHLLENSTKNPGQAGEVWLVFFDAEDNGHIPGWDWILGSQAFVSNLKAKPDAAVIIDMIGDSDLNIYKEKNSHSGLTDQIWDQAARLGYSAQFIPQYKHRMLDDHLPFVQAGIPAVDIIDFEYPYWHTTADLPDKVGAASLKAVGDVLLAWLEQQGNASVH